MTEYIDPFDYLDPENIDEELEMFLDDPSSVEFRPNTDEEIEMEELEDPSIRFARADIANDTVLIKYDFQDLGERYVVLTVDEETALVESRAKISTGEYSTTNDNYHIATPETCLMYDGDGYSETVSDLPRQAARKAPELLEKAEEIGEPSPKSVAEVYEKEPVRDPVPPPPKDPIFDD